MKFEIPKMTPELVIEILIRRRWIIMFPLSVALLLGIYLSIVLPKTFSASTLILVEDQSVPKNFVRSIVTEDPASRMGTISQQILSRTNLEKIIKDFNLFVGTKYDQLYMEDKLADLRKKIAIQVIRGRAGANAFSISFEGGDPQKVMEITQSFSQFVYRCEFNG